MDDQRRSYLAYKQAASAVSGGPGPDVFGPYSGRRNSLPSLTRYDVGMGQMIDATDRVAFNLDENGGPVDIQPGYQIVETESGQAFEVVDVRNVPGWAVVTLKTSAALKWHSPDVVP